MASSRAGLLGRCLVPAVMTGILALAALSGQSVHAEPTHLRVVGGLANVAQFTRHEEPFWRERIARLSNGAVSATIHSFDRAGLRGADMLRHVRSGVVPFGTFLVAQVAGDEPELTMSDLPGLSVDVASLTRHVALHRPRIEQLLLEKHGIKLLAIYTYPAQVLFCREPFSRLADIAGRRVRSSAVAMSEFLGALGARPIAIPFAETHAAFARGAIDCAVTGTLSGFEIGLGDHATHQHTLAVGWGLSIFGANIAAWRALPPDVQHVVQTGLVDLEREIWAAAEADTVRGTACNTGSIMCGERRRGRMVAVQANPADDADRRRILADVVLPRWVERCGPGCAEAWNASIGAAVGIRAPLTPAGQTANR